MATRQLCSLNDCPALFPTQKKLLLMAVAALCFTRALSQRQITISNRCPYTVWPANIPAASSSPLSTGGFELAPGATSSISLPTGWSGRFWGRTGCNFNNGMGTCLTGSCGQYMSCPAGVGGTPPVSLAEITLGTGTTLDFYDVSLVDGFNVPMSFGPVGADVAGFTCGTPSCSVNINANCPADLQVTDSGTVVACKSLCTATQNPQYCCSGAYNTPQTCSINYQASMFEGLCPSVYTWAYDDPSSTFTCAPQFDYSLVFCPESNHVNDPRDPGLSSFS